MENTFNGLDRGFNALVLRMAERCLPKGFDVAPDAPDTLPELKAEFERRRRLTVYDGASDKTIFDDAEVNYAFRAWHDWCHLTYDLPFDTAGEARACAKQQEHVMVFLGQCAKAYEYCEWIEAEVVGQTAHYERYGAFPMDQKAFVKAYAGLGPSVALAVQW